jgi:acylphosphatase
MATLRPADATHDLRDAGPVNVTRLLRIHGRVQGVGFRDAMEREARRLGVAGWVRNCRDGGVEAVVQGSPDAVDAILSWARRGPALAHVTDVAVSEAGGHYMGFVILPTG